MSDPRTGARLRDYSERRESLPAPCFKCNEEPRLEGHTICAKCHDPLRCRCRFNDYRNSFPEAPVRVATPISQRAPWMGE